MTILARLVGSLWRLIALLALLTIGVVNAALNARFGYLLGEDEVSRWGFMVLSIAVDIAKWTFPIAAALAWRDSAYLRCLACLVLWLWAGFYSLTAAVGFSAYNRDLMSAGRSETLADRTRAEAAWKSAQASLDTLLTSPRWTSTQACTNATAPASKTFCAEVEAARVALADADRRLSSARAITSTDPQAEFWARQFDIPLARVQLGLTLLIAVTAEIMTMLGFFAISSTPSGPVAPPADQPPKASQTPSAKVFPVDKEQPPPEPRSAVPTPPQPSDVVMKRPPARPPRLPPPAPPG